MKRVLQAVLLCSFVCATAFGQQASESNGVKPLINGGERAVQNPESVQVDEKTKTVMAESMQDGINTAIEEMLKPSAGNSWMIKTPSGVGFVAAGSSSYGDPTQIQNPTMVKITKRLAFVTALERAKVELAKSLGEMSLEAKEELRETLRLSIADERDMAEITSDSAESINRAVHMVLRGYMVYDVSDLKESNTVRVSIVTSPATRGEINRLSNGLLEAESIAAGTQHVLAEVNNGMIPLVGGRVIYVPQTGEHAYVGFGSAVVAANPNATIQSRLRQSAQNFAQARAEVALCRMIIGDEFQWSSGLTEDFTGSQSDDGVAIGQANSRIKEEAKNDPLNDANQNRSEVARMNATRNAFKATMEDSEEFKSAFQGKIPMGTNSTSWIGEDGWAYSFCIYMPSSANIAADIKKKMETAQIVKPIEAVGSSPSNPTPVNRGAGQTGRFVVP